MKRRGAFPSILPDFLAQILWGRFLVFRPIATGGFGRFLSVGVGTKRQIWTSRPGGGSRAVSLVPGRWSFSGRAAVSSGLAAAGGASLRLAVMST
jgi:hypothetical protein